MIADVQWYDRQADVVYRTEGEVRQPQANKERRDRNGGRRYTPRPREVVTHGGVS